ncbi:MAG: hypothetical protein U0835_13240 [Isosphaeraceae bacterium]
MTRPLFVTRPASRSRGAAAALLLAAAFFCPARPAEAQVLHVVVVCDYKSPDIKDDMIACAYDLVSAFQAVPPSNRRIHVFEPWFDPTRFEAPAAPGGSNPPAAATRPPATPPEVTEPESWTGPNPFGQVRKIHRLPSARTLLQAIAELGRTTPIGPRDAVACVLVGHGSYDPTPDPATGKPKGTYVRWRSSPEPLLVSEIAAALRKHPARLRVVVADCCNRLRPLSRKGSSSFPTYAAPAGGPVDAIPPLLKSLFFDERGEIVLESSSPNEFAFIEPPVETQSAPYTVPPAPGEKTGRVVQPEPTTMYRGSLFVNAFRDTLGANLGTPFTWEQVSELMQLRVDLRVKELRYAGLLVLDDQEQRGPADQRSQTLRLSRGQ